MTDGKYIAHVRWMTAQGPSETELTYANLKSYFEDKDSGRLILNFDKYDLWLFVRHMATFRIEPQIG